MDTAKRDRLVTRLTGEPEPRLVPIGEFFDGNDDLGSIGCNLSEHPGVAAFRDAFAHVAARPDVEAVYAQIAELDPGDDCWPFADTVFVVGAIPPDELARELEALEPDEVGPADGFDLPESLTRYRAPVLVAWWD